MKQIVDKLNNIAKAIDENVELPTTDLIVDSLDAITRAYGGTPSESNLIVDKLEDIEEVAHGGITPTGNIAITENTTEPLDISEYATATVNVPSTSNLHKFTLIDGNFQSMNIGQGYGIYLPDTYVCAYKNFHLVIDGVELENLKIFVYNGQIMYGTSLDKTVMLVSPFLLGELTLHGVGIIVNDTEPTTHHIEFYYYSECPLTFQIVENTYQGTSLFVTAYFVGMGEVEQGGIIEHREKMIQPGYYSNPMMQVINPDSSIYGHALEGEDTFVDDRLRSIVDTNSCLGGTIDPADYDITYSINNGVTNNLVYYTVTTVG